MRYFYFRTRERLTHWLARHLPRYLVYWCAIVLIVYATGEEYGDTIVPELTAMDALKRWEIKRLTK